MVSVADKSIPKSKRVMIIAPGMAFNSKELKTSVEILKSWGMTIDVPRHLISAEHPVSAHSENQRWLHLEEALHGPCDIIWAARGGYGSLHLIKYLAKLKKPKKQKLLIGFSDITTLHQFFNGQWGWKSLHGPHVDKLYQLNTYRQAELKNILFGKKQKLEFSLKPLNKAAQNVKIIKSSVVGGNLITTQSTFGTPWQIQTKNRILFLEDIGERGYKVDRVLEHMSLLGLIKSAKAIIFGPFVGGEEPGGKKSKVDAVIQYFAQNHSVPVFRGINSGHIPQSKILPFSTSADLYNSKLIVSTEIVP